MQRREREEERRSGASPEGAMQSGKRPGLMGRNGRGGAFLLSRRRGSSSTATARLVRGVVENKDARPRPGNPVVSISASAARGTRGQHKDKL